MGCMGVYEVYGGVWVCMGVYGVYRVIRYV